MTTSRTFSRRRLLQWAGGSALLASAGLALSACAEEADATTTSSTEPATEASAAESTGATYATTTAGTISATVEAANAFLDTLTDDQRAAVVYDYDDEFKTISWSNFPVTFVERAGLNLHDLSEDQVSAAYAVLQALLSEAGYTTVTEIIGGDEFLLEYSSSTEDSLGQYYIAFFGEPTTDSAFELQFGGHHLGINATLDGAVGAVTFAPSHLGSQPAVYTDADGNDVQPLAGMYEDAFALYDSMSDDQLATFFTGEQLGTMQSAPGDVSDYPTGTGIAGADLSDEQRELLLTLVTNWVGLSDEQTTADALALIEATLDDTYVSWSGATSYDMTQGDGIYYMVSGPNVYIELASQNGSAGADVDGYVTAGWGHIHTIYRDPTNDYANSVTQQAATGMGAGGGAPGGGGPNG